MFNEVRYCPNYCNWSLLLHILCKLRGGVNNINLKDRLLSNILMIQVLDQNGQQKMRVISWNSKKYYQLCRKLEKTAYSRKNIILNVTRLPDSARRDCKYIKTHEATPFSEDHWFSESKLWKSGLRTRRTVVASFANLAILYKQSFDQ